MSKSLGGDDEKAGGGDEMETGEATANEEVGCRCCRVRLENPRSSALTLRRLLLAGVNGASSSEDEERLLFIVGLSNQGCEKYGDAVRAAMMDVQVERV